MKKTLKRVISLIAAAALAVGAAALCAVSAETLNYMGFRYSVFDGEITIDGYSGSEIDLLIPDEIGGIPVTAIGDVAFGDSYSIVSVTFGKNMTLIGEFAFGHCVSLRSVYYTGTETEWSDNVAVEDGNAPLLSADFTFGYKVPAFRFVPAKAPTCTEDGNTKYFIDRMTGKIYSDAEGVRELDETSVVVPAIGHDYRSVGSTTNSSGKLFVTYVCSRCGETRIAEAADGKIHFFSDWTVTVAPGCTEKGERSRSCADCGLTETEEVPAAGHDFGADGNAERCSRCGAANPGYVEPLAFTDVSEDAYYADAIRWAARKKITEGTSATTFSPSNGCTRAQVVTFLWRAAGCPDPRMGIDPFSDVREEAFFYPAVLWAVEQGITVGTGASEFSPGRACTRAQIVTFLHRAFGTPEPKMAMNPFSDVKTDDYFASAVLWAVGSGITLGTGEGRFSPDATCTRAQIVSFLYRGMTDPAER